MNMYPKECQLLTLNRWSGAGMGHWGPRGEERLGKQELWRNPSWSSDSRLRTGRSERRANY